ncbi:MAG: serine/threonine-protein kinase, partial [Gemmatimonadota bacterium]
MTTSNWSRVKQIFHEALEVSGPERDQLVDGLCGDDEGLRSQVGALLAAHHEADELLDAPTVAGANAAASAASGLASAAAPEGPGTRVGAYKLLQQIGEGGFGTVYMAEQEEPIRRRVALKIIKPGMDTKQVIARFEAERQALAMMDHPNIAKVFDAGATETGRPYFVMELVRGVPITEYCDEYYLSTRERLELFNEVCGALHHAHQNGIIHRDIKPTNVMVTLHDGTPVPKVIDFGVAKATHQRLTEKTLFTEYNQFIGTPAYMSPEQAALGGLEIDNRSDVYSLGVLLYELLTGTTPFDLGMLRRAAYAEVLRILKEEDPPKPSTRVSTPGDWPEEAAGKRQIDPYGLARILRGDLDWIVMKALEKNRSRRYETAADIAADVRRYFDQEPIQARPPTFVYRTRKFVNKRVRPLSAAAVLVLLLGLEGVRSAWFTSDAPAVRGTAALAGPRLLMT